MPLDACICLKWFVSVNKHTCEWAKFEYGGVGAFVFLFAEFALWEKGKKRVTFFWKRFLIYNFFTNFNKKSKKRKHSRLLTLANSCCCYLFIVYSFIFIITDHLLVL